VADRTVAAQEGCGVVDLGSANAHAVGIRQIRAVDEDHHPPGLQRSGDVPADRFEGLALWSILGGFIGARLFHVVDRWDLYSADPLTVIAIWQGGLAVYGGLIGGVIGGLAYALKTRLPVGKVADIAAPAVILGQAVGRLGCRADQAEPPQRALQAMPVHGIAPEDLGQCPERDGELAEKRGAWTSSVRPDR